MLASIMGRCLVCRQSNHDYGENKIKITHIRNLTDF